MRVYYEDTDAGGVVYHANYLRYMERCRSDQLHDAGWGVKRILDELSIQFAVRSVNVQYLLPARLNDELTVSAEVMRLGHASVDVHQEVCRGTDLLCAADIRLAVLDRDNFSPTPIPEVISKEMNSWKQA